MANIEIHDPKFEKPICYYMNDGLKKSLDEKVIPDIQRKDKDVVLVIDGGEGCFFKDTLIKTTNGDIKIEDLNNGKPFKVYSLDIDKDETKENKAICVPSGEKELFEIETIDGRTIKATAEHTFFILRDKKVYEVKLSDLKEGDELVCQ